MKIFLKVFCRHTANADEGRRKNKMSRKKVFLQSQNRSHLVLVICWQNLGLRGKNLLLRKRFIIFAGCFVFVNLLSSLMLINLIMFSDLELHSEFLCNKFVSNIYERSSKNQRIITEKIVKTAYLFMFTHFYHIIMLVVMSIYYMFL